MHFKERYKLAFFYKGANPNQEGSVLITQSPSKDPIS